MEKAGFTPEEFALLNQAEDNSNTLIKTETVAMNAVKGLFEDKQGNFTVRGEPDQVTAIARMHDQAYHNEKARIMEPVNQFLSKLDERTSTAVQDAQKRAQTWLYILLFLCLLTFLILGIALALAWRYSQQQLGAEPSLLNKIAQRQAEGYLDVDNQKRSGVAASMQAVSRKLREVLGIAQQGTQSVSAVADQLSNASEQLSTGMAAQSERVTQIASASIEMAQTASEIADNVNSVEKSAMEALELAEAGGTKVSQSTKSMDDIFKYVTLASDQAGTLEVKANQVQEVVGIISSIAEQTNLLALNATHEINTIIGSMQESVNQVIDSMDKVSSSAKEGKDISQDAAQSFTKIISSIQLLQEHVTQNRASIDGMSSTADQITADIQAIADVSQESLASSQHIAESASELVENMQSLNQSAAYFKI